MAQPYPRATGGSIALSWAPMDSQGYQDLRQYKEPGATPDQVGRLRTLFGLSLTHHRECIVRTIPGRPFGVAHVPSTSGTRPGPHPIETLLLPMLSNEIPRTVPVFVGPPETDRNARRQMNPDNWSVAPPAHGVDRVLVIDDSWVTGGHAHSVASAFERIGVAARIIVLGRVLDPTRNDHGRYLREHPAEPFDSRRCPIHGEVHA
ncbi:hypothetical protein [Microbacterium oleivorans]|uniref:hypothetical protein n=1 Tax=Microbacterium oleivorans TaxID=273677 RepID=UPI001C4A031D|nr:hypothetical protein [Microbacterium oleivorans]